MIFNVILYFIKIILIFFWGGENDNINIFNKNNFKFIEKIQNTHNDNIYGFFEIKNQNSFG